MNEEQYYLAIDGGGTKTDAILFCADGRLVGRAVGAGTNPNGMAFDRVTANFRTVFRQLFMAETPAELSGCFAGLSGSDHPQLMKKLAASLRAACPIPLRHLEIGNDAMNALWSGTDGGPGLVVIAGTGSIAFGMKPDATSFRIGGWGYLYGDEGSGYDIGREAIRQALRTVDGREKRTLLTEAICAYFQVEKTADIVPPAYRCDKKVVAGLAPVVARIAAAGDPPAGRILDKAAQNLIELVRSGLSRFEQTPMVVLAGGLWKCTAIRRQVQDAVNVPVVLPACPPVYGSAVRCILRWEQRDTAVFARLKKQLSVDNNR
jgi:N-acetylglucosamine kinase-like BadF-type ATPase